MAARVFLGWDRPFSERVADWLLERRDALPEMLVLAPTGGSGRRLREALAVAAGSVLAPRVATPGALLRAVDEEPGVAPEWMERVAWVVALEGVGDWSGFADLFPEPPGEGVGWAWELAGEMTRLRRSLQDGGLLLADAARRMGQTGEGGRWKALARLEERAERVLRSWGKVSRSGKLACGWPVESLPAEVVLAGVADLPPLLEDLLRKHGRVTALVAAPEDEAEGFDDLGLPLASWNRRELPWPSGDRGSVRLAADARHQAAEAVACLAEAGTPSEQVALGSADDEVAVELCHEMRKAGWAVFHPGAQPAGGGLRGFLYVWRRWLETPELAVMADLLAFPECGLLLGIDEARRGELALLLAKERGKRPCNSLEDLARGGADAASVRAAGSELERWRPRFSREPFTSVAVELLDRLEGEDAAVRGWLEQGAELSARLGRPAGFWLDVWLESLPQPAVEPPEERVADVQGWLELLYESGPHLVLCGMNDSKVPFRSGGDPWLGEGARKALGLPGEERMAARDAFLFKAMLEARRDGGRVDLICGKAGGGGDVMLPSRLLLAADRDGLPARVARLFREVTPPDAGLRRETDWKWRPPAVEPKEKIYVTGLGAYLACPFRYYLSHVCGMGDPETGRMEWNARDFGNIAHDVLETWGDDPEAREFSKTEALADWLNEELSRRTGELFGARVPLAVCIQLAALRQRLGWFARKQAVARAEGWRVVDVERRVEMAFGDSRVVARIDRIDRHEGSGAYRVLDYKTGSIRRGVDGMHRVRITSATVLPAHFGDNCPAVFTLAEKGKDVEYRWTNLQLPLYAAALLQREMPLATPCYFTLGESENAVKVEEWKDFNETVVEQALRCAAWVVGQIRSGVFWPPAPRPEFDDFRDLAGGGPMEEAVQPPPFEGRMK